MIKLALALGLAALVACGPSGKQVAIAKTARYQGDKLALFNAIKSATETKHKLQVSDQTTLGLQTVGRWYTAEGVVAKGGDDNIEDVPDQSIRMSLTVRMLADGDQWVVEVAPNMVRHHAGRPNPDKLDPTDPSVPGWAMGQVDQLQYEIHTALKPYEVKPGPPGPARPPAAASSASDPAGSGSAAGSATPATP